MKMLFQIADRYISESDWRTFAVLKVCLLSLGVLVGIHVPAKAKKPARIGCLAVFTVTVLPLLAKLGYILRREGTEE